MVIDFNGTRDGEAFEGVRTTTGIGRRKNDPGL